MFKWLLILLVLVYFCSCKGRNTIETSISTTDSFHIIQNYLSSIDKEKEIANMAADSAWLDFLKITGLPDIRGYKHESYLFILDPPPFSQPALAYVVQKKTKETYELTTKFIFNRPDMDTVKWMWRKRPVYLYGITVFDSSKQSMSADQWYKFKWLLEGSYYHAFENPCPNGSGYMDGNTLTLESKSNYCCCDTGLTFHRTFIHVPGGSFMETLKYLAKISIPIEDEMKLERR